MIFYEELKKKKSQESTNWSIKCMNKIYVCITQSVCSYSKGASFIMVVSVITCQYFCKTIVVTLNDTQFNE